MSSHAFGSPTWSAEKDFALLMLLAEGGAEPPNGLSTGGSVVPSRLPPHRVGLTALDAAWHTGEGGQQRLTRPVCSPTSRGGGKTARVIAGRAGPG